MDWNRKVIFPKEPPMANPKKFHSPCHALMRFFTGIGFISCCLGVFYLGQNLLNLTSNVWDTSHWDFKMVLLLIISVVAGSIGGLMGAMVGLSFNVTNKKANYALLVLWHYLAMGLIFWYFLFILCLVKIYGAAGIKQFMNQMGQWKVTIDTLAIGISGSLLIGALLLITGLLNENTNPKMVYCVPLALPISMAMGYFQFKFLAMNTNHWILMGILFPIALILSATSMINRDKEERRHILENRR